MKIATIIGARPQFVKASIVSHTLRKHSKAEEFLIHTGQHYDVSMSDIFFSQLSMKDPRYNLNISGSTHGDMTGRMIISIEQVLLKEKPDVVLVYGDTNSTLSAAIAASKLMIPIAHVEAGLRSFNMSMPEEINRILTDRVSELLFTPCESADQNLLMEGVPKNKIIRSGDVMLDVLLKVTSASDNKEIAPLLSESKSYVLATVHRQENTDNIESWKKIIGFINDISQQSKVIWPVHPRVSSKIPRSIRGNRNIELVEPLGYLIEVIEWWQTVPQGVPGTFALKVGVLDTGITEEMYLELERLVDDAKPVSRQLTGLAISLETQGALNIGVALYEGGEINVYPPMQRDIDVTGYIGASGREHSIDTLDVYP